MEESNSGSKKILAIVGLLVIVAVIGIGVVVANQSGDQTANTTPTPTPVVEASTSPTASSSVEAANTSAYKDGSYSATGEYQSPGGNETIKINLTLRGGQIIDTSAQSGSTNPTGRQYQGQFISGYKAQVVGKSIDDLNISRVSGSSLTSGGFKDAVNQIKSQAKS
jgi:uncharacterized protein with FMN-binding domain